MDETFNVRCEWGLQGLNRLAPDSDVLVVVDVLSFSTCVDIALGRGAIVYPFTGYDASAQEYAASLGAELAGRKRSAVRYTLSPTSLQDIPAGARLVLPSPNGSALSLAAPGLPIFTACLRNYPAVAAAVISSGRRVALIPAGERWPDGSLRPALEDWLGAGALASCLPGRLAPEAQAALASFQDTREQIEATLFSTPSGRELAEAGFAQDVRLAAQLETSRCAPCLVDGAYRCVDA
jgi:2-phosphosulfolactate phosphatase